MMLKILDTLTQLITGNNKPKSDIKPRIPDSGVSSTSNLSSRSAKANTLIITEEDLEVIIDIVSDRPNSLYKDLREKIKKAEHIDLSEVGRKLYPSSLERIIDLSKNLKSINLSGCSAVSENSLSYLKECKQLETINLSGIDKGHNPIKNWDRTPILWDAITDQVLKNLATLHNLKQLDLRDNRVIFSDKRLAPFSKNENITIHRDDDGV